MANLLSKLWRRREFRFLLVGATNTAVCWLIYVMLTLSFAGSASAGLLLVIAYIPATAIGYVLQRKLVWQSTNQKRVEGTKYVLTSAIQASANAALLYLLCDLMKLDRLVTQTVLTAVFVVLTYFTHRVWTFRAKNLS